MSIKEIMKIDKNEKERTYHEALKIFLGKGFVA